MNQTELNDWRKRRNPKQYVPPEPDPPACIQCGKLIDPATAVTVERDGEVLYLHRGGCKPDNMIAWEKALIEANDLYTVPRKGDPRRVKRGV